MELQQPPDSMKLSAYGTREGIRTPTVLILNQMPPASWATRAYGGKKYFTFYSTLLPVPVLPLSQLA